MLTDNNIPDPNRTEITDESEYYLKEISRWAQFLSVVGFIMIGILAIGVFTSSALIYCMSEHAPLSEMYPHRPGTINWSYLFVYGCVLTAYFFPIFYLYKFSRRIRRGINDKDSITISEGFRFLKNHYVMIGTLTLLGLIFSVIFFGFVFMDIIRCFQ